MFNDLLANHDNIRSVRKQNKTEVYIDIVTTNHDCYFVVVR